MPAWHTFAPPHGHGSRRLFTINTCTEPANLTNKDEDKHKHTHTHRKRKRDEDSSDNDSPSSSSVPPPTTSSDPDEEIPLQPQKTAVLDLNPLLAHLDPSWYEPSTKPNHHPCPPTQGLRETHLANLTTLMHHMLLKGDFERAGRAWALLLRSGRLTKSIKTTTGFLSMDVTARNRWGIGAELLLRKTQHEDQVRHSDFMQGADAQSEDMHFSEEGFKAAREYYERLIVQYPVHHQRKGPSATKFYAAMFSLWIYEASQRSKYAEQRLANRPSTSPAFGPSPPEDGSDDGREGRLRTVKARELEDAKMIASRLDDVIAAPPLDKNAELLQIRGMVALWVGTLQGGEAEETNFERAKGLLLRSRANGGTLWEGVENIVEEDDW